MRFFTFVLVLACAAGAAAQEPAPSQAPPQLPRWDASGGLGTAVAHASHFGLRRNPDPSYWEDGKAEPRFQIGRYFTEHLKGELAVSRLRYDLSEFERIPAAGLPNGGYGITDRTVRLVGLAPALTYQFFENTFAHPFVSGGVSVDVLSDRRHREAAIHRSGNITYRVPAVDTRRTVTLVRPFVAGGFKSYFNQRTFLRPEIRTGFGPAGASLVGLRLDLGFDF